MCGLLLPNPGKSVLFHLSDNSHRFVHTSEKRSSTKFSSNFHSSDHDTITVPARIASKSIKNLLYCTPLFVFFCFFLCRSKYLLTWNLLTSTPIIQILLDMRSKGNSYIPASCVVSSVFYSFCFSISSQFSHLFGCLFICIVVSMLYLLIVSFFLYCRASNSSNPGERKVKRTVSNQVGSQLLLLFFFSRKLSLSTKLPTSVDVHLNNKWPCRGISRGQNGR